MEDDNKCIVNWELHHQINSKRKIDTKYKYESPNKGKKPGLFKRFIYYIMKLIIKSRNLRKNRNEQKS